MLVKIKHIQLKSTQWVGYEEYYHKYKDNALYKTFLIKDVYELYNRMSGIELWQATIYKEQAIEVLNKHPNIFRIEYSDKNTQSVFYLFLEYC